MRSIVVPSGPRSANSRVAASRILRWVPAVSHAIARSLQLQRCRCSDGRTSATLNPTTTLERGNMAAATTHASSKGARSARTQNAAPTPVTSRPAATMTPGLMLLLALIGGFAVGNLYWAQPLLSVIAADLGVSTGTAGSLVTLTQIGYAVGIVLIVPLGDVANRRRLIPLMLGLSAIALVACAVAPSFIALLVAVAVLGLTTVAGQIVIPLAGDLASDSSRGRVVGTVMTGFLAGTIVSRTLSGLVAQLAGWRAIYVLAAVVMVALAVLAHRKIPQLPAPAQIRYPALLASVGGVVRKH